HTLDLAASAHSGDKPMRRSTFDAILAVFFEDATARRQYGWHLPRSGMASSWCTYYIPKESVVFDGVKIVIHRRSLPRAPSLRHLSPVTCGDCPPPPIRLPPHLPQFRLRSRRRRCRGLRVP
ncbi:Os07g0562051, partial [Oryza sativa Japonica Group]